MPSPFPGMDPWLESPAIFPDLHHRLIAYLGEALNEVLPKPYYSTIANRIYVESSDRLIEPDVSIFGAPPNGPTDLRNGVALGAKPIVVHAPRTRVTEWYLEIHSAPDGSRLVTTVEVLSRANKREGSKGRRLYRKKQRELMKGRVNTVEIDLLRFGSHTTIVPHWRSVRAIGSFDYHICIHRPSRHDDYEVYPIRLPERMPQIALPLLKDSSDVGVDLQPLFDRCYDSALFSRRIQYAETCSPRLTPDQQTWAESILRAKGILPPV